MSLLKNLLVIAVLVAVSCGVYVVVNRGGQTSQTPDGTSAWSSGSGPNVQMPGPGSAMSPMPMGNTAMGGAPTSDAPPYGSLGAAPSAMAPNDPNMLPSGTYGATDPMASAPAFVPPEVPPTPVDARMDSMAGASPYPAVTEPGGGPIASSYSGATEDFETAKQAIQSKLDQGLLADALLDLSRLHDGGQVPPEQVSAVQELLDQLAGTVVYSRQHLMEDPYTVRPGDTLEQIAALYQVPASLLANINGVLDPTRLEPGTPLKVVRGPFDAQIDLTDMELTLRIGGRYAGRFAIGVGQDQPNLEGTFVVSGQTVDPVYYGPDRTRIEAGDPNNPFGEFLISLGSQPDDPRQIGIHGTNDPRNLHHIGGQGTIRLGERDIEDVFGILSIGSRVIIRR